MFNSRSSFYKSLSGICLLILMVYFKVMSSPISLNAVLTKTREASHCQTFSMCYLMLLYSIPSYKIFTIFFIDLIVFLFVDAHVSFPLD